MWVCFVFLCGGNSFRQVGRAQGAGVWALHSLVDPTRKHLPEVLSLGRFVENNSQYVQGDGGLSKRWRRMSVGGDPSMPTGNQRQSSRLVLGSGAKGSLKRL